MAEGVTVDHSVLELGLLELGVAGFEFVCGLCLRRAIFSARVS